MAFEMALENREAQAPVSFFDYRPGFAAHEHEFRAAFDRVMASGQLILGSECKAFESEFASYLGVDQVVGVNSGTDALILALRVLGISDGDEVITVANTAVPTLSAIRAVGAAPVCVDVDPDTLLMDLDKLPAALTQRTRAIIPVHLFGNAVPMAPLLAFARRHGLRVIEDCAQSTGTLHEGRHLGAWGDIGCFSFYPTKNLGAYGDGGACVTADPALARALRMQRMYGFGLDPATARYSYVEGLNSRLDGFSHQVCARFTPAGQDNGRDGYHPALVRCSGEQPSKTDRLFSETHDRLWHPLPGAGPPHGRVLPGNPRA